MMNMSYCRFENTYIALCECVSAINEMVNEEKNTLSESEENKRISLKVLCQEFIDACDELEELEDV